MPSKKHLDSQGRRRTNRRRAVRLSEFLRGDEESTVQVPVPQAESQNTNESSIGTIPSVHLPASYVTVSPVVTPDIPTGEPEKVTCPALGNLLPESLLPKGAAGKDQAVASWLSSVRSAVDNCQGTKTVYCSPPRKKVISQQPKSPAFSSEQKTPKQPDISPNEPALTAAIAAVAGPQLNQPQKQPEKSPESSSEKKLLERSPAGSSKQKISENPSARETKPLAEFHAGNEDVVPASQFNTQDPRQSICGNRSFWEESDDSSLEDQTMIEAGEREGAVDLLSRQDQVLPPIRRSLLNANAQEFRPIVREQERDQEQLSLRRHCAQRIKRSLKRRQLAQVNWGQAFEDQEPAQSQQAHRQRLGAGPQQEQSQDSIALPSCYYSAPAGHQCHQKEAAPVSQKELHRDNDAAPAPLTVYGAPRATSEYVAAPATSAAAAPTSHTPIRMQNNADVSQSIFQMTCLPSAGLGTRYPPPSMDTSSINPMPSSISCASLISHTLSSLPPVEEKRPDSRCQESIISPDLFYNRSLLDMDREDTQEEEEEDQASPYQQWEWQLNSNRKAESEREQPRHPRDINAEASVVPAAREPLFRSPSSHGEGYPQPDLNCVPANIKKLHKTVTQRYSDYAFVYALCAQLGQECVPMDCYVYLKMVLLASIVSIEPDELRPPISLCVISTDSLMANRLMNCIGQLAPRFLGPHEYGLQPTISGGQLSSSRYTWVVASPLLLAQQGVYYAGDWTRLSKEQGEQIEKCIENGSVPVPQLQSDQALEAAVWTHWQPENSTNQTLAFAKLCPIFGMPIYMGNAAGSNSDSLWNFLLRQHTMEAESDDEQPEGLNIPEEDMRMLLHLLHQRQITFQDDAQHMLQKYYVISRKERPTVFTSKTYIVLKQFAESFAKLALRLEVLESDVCVAIFHCEHFVQQIFGGTSPTPPAVNSFNVISHIDPYMNEFARWLLQFLNRYQDEELGMHKAKRRRTDSWDFP